MAIITISRGSFSYGRDVAEKVASRLGYRCIGREALLEAAEEYDVPEIKLTRAIHDPPSIFDRLTGGRKRYIAFIKAALLHQLRTDDVVYHGLAAGYFLMGVSHVLKVRVLADPRDRVRVVMERDGVSEARARAVLEADDRARRQWGLQLYGIDPTDPALYDAVVHVGKMGVEGAADVVCGLAAQEQFRTTAESRVAIEQMALEASVEALLAEEDLEPADVKLSVGDGAVRIGIRTSRGVRDGTTQSVHAYSVRQLRRRLQERGSQRLEAKVTVELVDVEG